MWLQKPNRKISMVITELCGCNSPPLTFSFSIKELPLPCFGNLHLACHKCTYWIAILPVLWINPICWRNTWPNSCMWLIYLGVIWDPEKTPNSSKNSEQTGVACTKPFGLTVFLPHSGARRVSFLLHLSFHSFCIFEALWALSGMLLQVLFFFSFSLSIKRHCLYVSSFFGTLAWLSRSSGCLLGLC